MSDAFGDELETGEEKVGYKRPPRGTRWKKGQSGNPSGRKKGSRGLKTDLHAELNNRLAITINRKTVKGTTQQLMLRTLAARAASGDIRASKVLIDLVLQVFGTGDRGGEGEKLSSQDQALLDEWLSEVGGPREVDPPAGDVALGGSQSSACRASGVEENSA